MNEFRSKLSPQEVEEIEREVSTLKNLHENKTLTHADAPKMREAIDKAKNAAMKIGQAMYRNTGSGSGTADQGQQQQQQQQQGENKEGENKEGEKKDEPKN